MNNWYSFGISNQTKLFITHYALLINRIFNAVSHDHNPPTTSSYPDMLS